LVPTSRTFTTRLLALCHPGYALVTHHLPHIRFTHTALCCDLLHTHCLPSLVQVQFVTLHFGFTLPHWVHTVYIYTAVPAFAALLPHYRVYAARLRARAHTFAAARARTGWLHAYTFTGLHTAPHTTFATGSVTRCCSRTPFTVTHTTAVHVVGCYSVIAALHTATLRLQHVVPFAYGLTFTLPHTLTQPQHTLQHSYVTLVGLPRYPHTAAQVTPSHTAGPLHTFLPHVLPRWPHTLRYSVYGWLRVPAFPLYSGSYTRLPHLVTTAFANVTLGYTFCVNQALRRWRAAGGLAKAAPHFGYGDTGRRRGCVRHTPRCLGGRPALR